MAEERRLVTVLFADVVESTGMGEDLDPEDIRALLGGYYAVAKDVVAQHGGTLEKFIGDAVMAVFGLPTAHGDDAQRALSSALEIRARVRRDPRLAQRVRIRMGLSTGEVVATLDRSAGDFLITGDPPNVAARLQQTARPWGILCAERTVRAAGTGFKFGPLFALELKGKRVPMQVAPLLGRQRLDVRVSVPLVGRDGDLAQLEFIGRRALAEKHPTLVSVIAPAGTGKSRLLEEFLARLPGIVPGATVVAGQCLPYGQRLTYWPLRSVLLRLVEAASADPPEAVRSKIRAWLGPADDRLLDRTAAVLAATVGAGQADAIDATSVHLAWRSAIEIACRRGPLVMVVEDLHWSSDSLLDLVELMQPHGDVPFLLIVLTRPELLDRRPSWGGGRRRYLALTLDPLPDDAVRQLVRSLLPNATPDVAQRLVERAEGNPFYAVELVRALADRLASLDEPTLERAVAALPDTVQATVLERLDLLAPEERRVMQLGAVLGRSFHAGGIVALAPELAAHAGEAIEGLLEKDFVRPLGMGGFVFRHILIREVAYRTLPRSARATLHAAAAAHLETVAKGQEEAFSELIAYHYREAAVLARADEDEATAKRIRASALLWLGRAAELALRSAAHVEAVRHLHAAAEFADPDELPDLYERIGDAFVSGDAVEAYRRVLETVRDAGTSPDRQLRAIAGMLHVTLRSGGTAGGVLAQDEVSKLRAKGRALLAEGASDVAVARFLSADAFWPFAIARGSSRFPTHAELEEAEASAYRAVTIAERLADTRLRSAAIDALGAVRSLRGDHTGARELARQRISLGGHLDLIERVDAYAVATWLSVWLGDLDEAVRTSSEGLALVQPGQATSWTLHLVSWRAFALMRRGDWDGALRAGERAREVWLESGRSAAGFALHGFVAALAVAHGRRDRELFERFRVPLEEIGRVVRRTQRHLDFLSEDPLQPGHYLRYLDQRQPETLELAIAFASDAGHPPAARLLHHLAGNERLMSMPMVGGEIKRAIGLATHDAASLSDAISLFQRCNALPSLARARCERARLTADLSEMEAGFEVLGRLGDIEQLARYRGSGSDTGPSIADGSVVSA